MLEGPSPNGFSSDGGRRSAHTGRAVLLITTVTSITWIGALLVGFGMWWLWPTGNPIEAILQGMRWSPIGAALAALGGAFLGLKVTGREGQGKFKVCALGAVAGVAFAVGIVIVTISDSRAGEVMLTISGIPFVGPLVAMVVFLAPGLAAALAVAFSRPRT